jgi:hypothetical protein
MFVIGCSVYPWQTFLAYFNYCKAGAYLSEASLLTYEYYTVLEKLAKDKHSRFLRTIVNYGGNKFYNVSTRSAEESSELGLLLELKRFFIPETLKYSRIRKVRFSQ